MKQQLSLAYLPEDVCDQSSIVTHFEFTGGSIEPNVPIVLSTLLGSGCDYASPTCFKCCLTDCYPIFCWICSTSRSQRRLAAWTGPGNSAQLSPGPAQRSWLGWVGPGRLGLGWAGLGAPPSLWPGYRRTGTFKLKPPPPGRAEGPICDQYPTAEMVDSTSRASILDTQQRSSSRHGTARGPQAHATQRLHYRTRNNLSIAGGPLNIP